MLVPRKENVVNDKSGIAAAEVILRKKGLRSQQKQEKG
jgi:hypothetical protein